MGNMGYHVLHDNNSEMGMFFQLSVFPRLLAHTGKANHQP